MSPEKTARVVSDRYELLEPLGKGGMGVVWRASDRILGREVAVKEVDIPTNVPGTEGENLVERVTREARAAAQLNHPGAVTIYDVVRDDGHAFVVMELIEAPTLTQIVEERGPLPVEEVRPIALELLDALDTAHSKGIVHRDVKPSNVMLKDGGGVKLADFGIASLTGDPKLTASGLILGSPSYMAPEQAEGKAIGPEADLWGLGATLYYCLEGQPPFDEGRAIPTLTAVVHDEPPAPQRAGSLEPLITALLQKDPTARPDADRAKALIDGEGTTKVQEVAAPDTKVVTATSTLANKKAPARTPQPVPAARPAPPQERNWLPLLGILALIGVAVLAFFALRNEETPTADPRAQNEQREQNNDGQRQGGGGTSEEEPESEEEAPAVAAPVDWTTYEDPDVGYTVSYPSNWDVVPASNSATTTDFRDPETGTYLRVDWTDSPGESASGAWEDSSASWAGSRDNYQEIRIDEVEFMGSDNAAEWEYTYTEGGANLHAINLGWVTPDENYGFALNFQTQEENWEESLDIFQQFKENFTPPE